MAVNVQSKSGGGVAQVDLYGLYIIPGADGVHGVCMAQIVKVGPVQTDSGPDNEKIGFGHLLRQRPAVLSGKDQAVRIGPQPPGFQLLFCLSHLLPLQVLKDGGGGGDCPGFSAFRRTEQGPGPGLCGKLFAYRDRHVRGPPGEAQQLRDTQPGMVPDVRIIGPDSCGLGAAQVFPLPDIQPLAKVSRGGVCPVVDGHGGGLQIFPDLFLRLSGKGR